MEPQAPRHRRPHTLIFDAARSPSISLLRGLEKPIPPDQCFIEPVPAPHTQKPLPDPPRTTSLGKTTWTGVITAERRDSDTSASQGRYTSNGHSKSNMIHLPPNAPSLHGYRHNAMLSTSSPSLSTAVIRPQLLQAQPQLLEPRVYSPLLPEPSSVLTPLSRRSSFGCRPTEHVAVLFTNNRNQDDELWRTLPPSPPATAPLPAITPRLMSPRSFEPLASPPQSAPLLRARSTSPPVNQLSRKPDVSHQREASIEKALENLGVNIDGEVDASRSRKRLKHPVGPRSTDYSHFTAGSKFNKQKLRAKTNNRLDDPDSEEYTGEVDSEGEHILSADYHTSLVQQYRALAAPVVGQWDDSTDDEEAASNFRFVPKPLFWKTKRRNESMDAQRYDVVAPPKISQTVNGIRRPSHSSAPMKMILPGHFKRRSDSSERSTAKQTKFESPWPRGHKQRAGRSKRTSAYTSKQPMMQRAGSQQREKDPVNEPPLPLQLPKTVAASIAAGDSIDDERFKAADPLNETIQAATSKRNVSPRTPLRPQVNLDSMRLLEYGPPSPNAGYAKSPSSGSNFSLGTNWSDKYRLSYNSDSQHSRAMDREHKIAQQEYADGLNYPATPSPEPVSMDTTGYTTGFKNALKRISPIKPPLSNMDLHSAAPSSTPRSPQSSHHTRDSAAASAGDWSARPSRTSADHQHPKDPHTDDHRGDDSQHRRGISMPRFVERRVERHGEKKREQRRGDLKASIRFVGQADPTRDVDFARKRETFGAGWT